VSREIGLYFAPIGAMVQNLLFPNRRHFKKQGDYSSLLQIGHPRLQADYFRYVIQITRRYLKILFLMNNYGV
jgi:hypothetical protein